MQNKPANWVTGFKRSPRAANVQNRDMGLFLNSSGKFEPIDDAWDNLHSGGLFISDDNKLYFRDETNKDIYINSPAAETLVLGAGNATTAGFITINEEGFDTDFRVEASGVANALFVQGSDGFVGIGTNDPAERLEVVGNVNQSDGSPEYHFETTSASHYNWRIACQEDVSNAFEIASGTQSSSAPDDTYTNRLVIKADTGNVGIGATPGTLLELFGTAPYLTLRNSTHEDGDGGRESKIIFEGEQSGGEDSTLAVIQASHDGTSDDQKGDLIFYTNDGSDNAAPTERMRIDSAGLLTATGDANFGANGSIRLRDPLAGNDAGIDIYRDGGVNPSIRLHGEGDSYFNGGDVGIGTDSPGTLLELFGTAPYLTLRNSTHEDGDGGRESKIIFEGEQSGGEDSTLAVIQASHDGTSDDQKGDLIFYTNDGNDNAAPTEAVRIDSGGNVAIGKGAADTGISLNSGSGNDSYINFNEGGSNKSYIRNEGTDDSFRINVASADRVTIDTSGNVNMPYQPAFQAKLSSDQTNLATGSNVTILFASDSATGMFDQGGDFNTGTYTFTAPVDGKYQFNVFLRLDAVDADASNYQIQLITSDYTYNNVIVPTVWDSDGYWTFAFSVLADMDANDTAYVVIFQSSGTAQTDVVAASTFSGVLIC